MFNSVKNESFFELESCCSLHLYILSIQYLANQIQGDQYMRCVLNKKRNCRIKGIIN